MALNLKPVLVHDHMRDQNRKALAAAIALHAGAKRDARVADEAARLAAERLWEAQVSLEQSRKTAPAGSLADTFTASVDKGNPCGVAVLERSSIDIHAKLAAAENDARVWDQTRLECDEAAREKESAVGESKERLERAARMVICNSENVAKLTDDLARLQTEIIERRSALRFISSHGCNGELAPALSKQIEIVLWQDLMWLEPTDSYRAWDAAFNELLANSDAALPNEG